ncbi:proline-rich protein 2-like [Caloenas nicobarica]|uniref:proline-rich protein 2-like n=1 Tax=Caloenas nicobarica TaxID=187106 RepID=UPI0032B81436
MVFKRAGCQQTSERPEPRRRSCAAATLRAPFPGNEPRDRLWKRKKALSLFCLGPRQRPRLWEGREMGPAGSASPAAQQTAGLVTPAGGRPLRSGQGGREGVTRPPPRAEPPHGAEGTAPRLPRPPAPRPEPAGVPLRPLTGERGGGPEETAAPPQEGRAEGAGGGRPQPAPRRPDSPRPLPSPRPDLPRGRPTQPRPVPSPHGTSNEGCSGCRHRHRRSRPPSPAPERPLPSRPVTTRAHTLQAPATSPGSRACVAGPSPAAGPGCAGLYPAVPGDHRPTGRPWVRHLLLSLTEERSPRGGFFRGDVAAPHLSSFLSQTLKCFPQGRDPGVQ